MEVIAMNRFVQTLIWAAIFLSSPMISTAYCQQEQNQTGGTKSTITIKTMRIENGDTIVTEKHYETDGDANIEFNDSTGDFDNSGFYKFRYNMIPSGPDSGLFDRSWMDMQDLFKEFDKDFNQNFGGFQDFEKNLQLVPDSLLKSFYSPDIDSIFEITIPDGSIKQQKPFDKSKMEDKPRKFNKDFQRLPPQQRQIYITDEAENTENLKKKKNEKPVPGFEITLNSTENYINLSFFLDTNKQSIISLTTAKGEELIKEVPGKGYGLFTRQFDLTKFGRGVYYIHVKQGSRISGKRLIIE
jgi:hypothetical protein